MRLRTVWVPGFNILKLLLSFDTVIVDNIIIHEQPFMIFGIWRARGDGGVPAAVSRHDAAACDARRYNEDIICTYTHFHDLHYYILSGTFGAKPSSTECCVFSVLMLPFAR